MITLTGRRTDAFTGKESEVEVRAVVRIGYRDLPWLHLLNGPTGAESIPVAAIADAIERYGGWSACAGTRYIPGGRAYDGLWIPGEELKKVLEAPALEMVE